MVSCKVCIYREPKGKKFSIKLKYANVEFPKHTQVFYADESVLRCAAHLLRKTLIDYDDYIMKMYDYKKDCFVNDLNPERDLHVVFTGAKKVDIHQVLDCINKLLIGIHNYEVDGELIVELDGVVLEKWRSNLFTTTSCSAEDSERKETKLMTTLLFA